MHSPSSETVVTLHDLTTISSLDLLLDLSSTERRLRVEFEGEGRYIELTVDRGSIRSASEVGAPRVGDRVVSAGLATQAEVEQAALAREDYQPLGLALVEQGLVSAHQMRELLSVQVASILEHALTLRSGIARVAPGDFDDQGLLRLPIRRCLYEAAREALSEDPFGSIGGLDARLRAAYASTDLVELDLEEEEFELLTMVDGRKRLEELLRAGRCSPRRSLGVLAAAFRLGLLDVVEAPTVRLKALPRDPAATTRNAHSLARSS